jgi:hypothetical protein
MVLKWLWLTNRSNTPFRYDLAFKVDERQFRRYPNIFGRTMNRRKIDMLKSQFSASLATMLVLASGFIAAADAATAGVKVGVLSCDVSGGLDVIRSSHALSCSYVGTGAQTSEHYAGHISSIGANLGYTKAAKMAWAVFAPSSDFKAKSLQGEYAGVTAGAAVGVGVGTNVLVGGLDKSISLQPVSFSGSEGVNIAVGISSIKLTAAD